MDVSKLCRSCMEEVAPWEREDANQNTVEMFSFCTNIEISKEDELPKHFCYNCTVLIESSYTYIRKARRVNLTLKKLTQNGSTTFVDNFLNRTIFCNTEDIDEKPIDIVGDQINSKTDENHLEHDIFDDDDDICLSKYKSVNLNKVKEEPIDYVDELSNTSLNTKVTALEVTNEAKDDKETVENNRCTICKKNFASKGWYSRHMKLAHQKGQKKKKRVVPIGETETTINGDTKVKKIKKKKTVLAVKTETEEGNDQRSIEVMEIKRTEDVNDNEIEKEDIQTLSNGNDIIDANDYNATDLKKAQVPKSPKKKKKVLTDPMQCKLCSKEFPSKDMRNMHMHHSKVVDGKRVFTCPYCPKTCENKETMDVSKLCRSCMEEVAPWEREDANQNTVEMFSFCTNIEISKEDELPKHFCYNCTVLIESSYTYIRKARRVNLTLKKLTQNGSTTFVDNFLNRTIFCNTEDIDEKPIDIVGDQINSKTDENHLEHDIFDDDDDICLSKYKSVNLNKVKEEPIDYVDELSNTSLNTKVTALEVTNEAKDDKETVENNRCTICKKNFASKGWYSRHMKLAHQKGQKKKKRVVPIGETETTINGDTKVKKIKKKKTVLAVKTETEEGNDQRSIEVMEIKRTEDVNDNEIEKEDIQTLSNGNDIIDANDYNATDLKKAQVPKSPKKKKKVLTDPMQCKLCSKEFPSKDMRNMHMHHSKVVDGKRVFTCPYCPKTFLKYSTMYYHATKHPEVRKHACNTCGKEYRIAKELQQHVLTHKEERPYACDKCHMKFKIKGILATHLKWHEGVRPYLCNVCGRSFMQSGNLESHMRVHTGERPYSCAVCPFRSGTRGTLKRHELRHRGERPYPCELCPKRFYESCSLARHVRTHTRERPYQCPYCPRRYYDSGKRRRHLVNTHKMAPDEIPPMAKNGGPIDANTTKNCEWNLKIPSEVPDISVSNDVPTVVKE